MQVYIGIDWSKAKHDLAFMNLEGRVVLRKVIANCEAGFWELERMREGLGIPAAECGVGIETADQLLVEFLWQQDYQQVYGIPPTMTKSSRGRQRSSPARSDASEAELLADLVRTDRHRLCPWRPNQLLTRQMAEQVSLLNFVTGQIVRLSNRLQAKLLRYYPAAVSVFSKIAQPISLAFLQAYPHPALAQALSWDEFRQFARQQGYSHPKRLSQCYAALQAAHVPAGTPLTAIYQQEALLLSQLLQDLLRAKKHGLQRLQALFQHHPDQAIFASLPGAGEWLAPALLVKFGDDRQRFPTPASVQMLAGTCPVTIQSGKRRFVHFRQACDREFRQIAVQFAKASLRQSPWAQAYFQQALPHTRSISHAYRCLANRWLAILWKLWQSRQAYDEAYHLQRCLLRQHLN